VADVVCGCRKSRWCESVADTSSVDMKLILLASTKQLYSVLLTATTAAAAARFLFNPPSFSLFTPNGTEVTVGLGPAEETFGAAVLEQLFAGRMP